MTNNKPIPAKKRLTPTLDRTMNTQYTNISKKKAHKMTNESTYLENWRLISGFRPGLENSEIPTSPDGGKKIILANIFKDGKITGSLFDASGIIARTPNEEIITRDGGPYILGNPNPSYAHQFKNPKEKLLESLPEISP